MSFVVSCRSCSAPLDVPDDTASGSPEAVLCAKCGGRTTVTKTALGYKSVFDVPTGELWLVSFGADDDRELTVSEIVTALEDRRIDKATLVWREGMPEWLPLARVPELQQLALREPAPPPRPKSAPPPKPAAPDPADLTGGFLGTGMNLGAEEQELRVVALSSRMADSGAEPVAEPAAEEAPPSSAAVLSSEELEDAPPSVAEPKTSLPPPAPRRQTERQEPATRSLPVAKKAPLAFTAALPEASGSETAEEEPPPSSHGTPDLRALALKTSLAPPAGAAPDDAEPAPATATKPKAIELESVPSNPKPFALEGPSSTPKPAEAGSRASAPPEASARSVPPGGRRRLRKDVRSLTPTRAAKPKEKSGGGAPLLLFLVALVLGVLWLVVRKPPTPPEPSSPPLAVATPSPAPPPVSAALQPEPEPEAEPLPSVETPVPADDRPAFAVTAKPGVESEPGAGVEAAASSTTAETEPDTALVDAGVATSVQSDAGEPETTLDRSAALAALAVTAAEAARCRKPGDPDGNANVVITFAPSGRVTSAVVEGPPFAGTPTGSCVAATMRRTTVPPFEGAYARVRRRVWVD